MELELNKDPRISLGYPHRPDDMPEQEYAPLDNLESRTLPEYPNYLILENGVVLYKKGKKDMVNYNENTYSRLKHYVNKYGHHYVWLFSEKHNRTILASVHSLVARSFLVVPESYQVIRHLDDVKSNNHYSNLAFGTHKDNGQDAVRNGKTNRGNRRINKNVLMADFTQEMKQELLYKYNQGSTYAELSDLYNSPKATIMALLMRLSR
jgi:HNH endonuclease